MNIFNYIILLWIICCFSIFSACSNTALQSVNAVSQGEYLPSELKTAQPKYPYMIKFFEIANSEQIVEESKRALNDDEYIRVRAAAALLVLTGENYIPGMGALSDERSLDELNESLKDDSIFVRSTAALALANSGDSFATRNAILALSKIMEDKNQSWVVHEFAAYCLGEIGDRRAVPSLLRALENQAIDAIAYPAILRSLGKIKDTRAVPVIGMTLQAIPEDSFVCESGLIALGEIGGDESVSLLINYFNNPEHDMVCRNYAAFGLGRTYTERAYSCLITALHDPNASVRMSAANSLGLYFESKAETELIGLLDDENKYVRLKAVTLLQEIGNHETLPFLKRKLNDEWQRVVDAAKNAIETINKRNNRATK